jgi:hypothetical protein
VVLSSPRTGPWAELTQLVECQLPKLDVAGSTPVLRSIFPLMAARGRRDTTPLPSEYPREYHLGREQRAFLCEGGRYGDRRGGS